jgi:hypothetical protein
VIALPRNNRGTPVINPPPLLTPTAGHEEADECELRRGHTMPSTATAGHEEADECEEDTRRKMTPTAEPQEAEDECKEALGAAFPLPQVWFTIPMKLKLNQVCLSSTATDRPFLLQFPLLRQ